MLRIIFFGRLTSLSLSLLLISLFCSLVQAAPISWEQKYADESSLDLLLERTVELHKDWSTQFNQVHIK